MRLKIFILTLLLGGCHSTNVHQTQMEHLYGRYEFHHLGTITTTRGTRDLQNSLIYYHTLWNKWPDNQYGLYNMINQQQTKTMDSLIVSLSEFQSLGLRGLRDTVTVNYNFKGDDPKMKKFMMTKTNDSTYQVIDDKNIGLIHLQEKHYR